MATGAGCVAALESSPTGAPSAPRTDTSCSGVQRGQSSGSRRKRPEEHRSAHLHPLHRGRAPSRRDGLWLRVTKIFVVAVVCFVAVTAGALFGWLQRTAPRSPATTRKRSRPPGRSSRTPSPASRSPSWCWAATVAPASPAWERAPTRCCSCGSTPGRAASPCSRCPATCWSTIPGYGQNKINAAYSFGGAKLSLEVTKRLLGVPINDFVDINFDGFKQVINKLGGAYLMIDRGYYNNTAVTGYASIDINPGYQRLNGAQALDWVRFRHDQNGDFTRIVRQQIFLREMKRELAGSATLTSLPRFLAAMTIISHNVTLRHLEPGQALLGAHPGPVAEHQPHLPDAHRGLDADDQRHRLRGRHAGPGARRRPSVPAPGKAPHRVARRRRRGGRAPAARSSAASLATHRQDAPSPTRPTTWPSGARCRRTRT